MKVSEIIELALERGDVCGTYSSNLRNASNLKEVMDIVMDANGLEWMASTKKDLGELDLRDKLLVHCPQFINGRYKAEFKNDLGNGYTSMLYVGGHDYKEMHIEAQSTILCLLRVHGEVTIPRNAFVSLHIDNDSGVRLRLEKNAKCIVNTNGKGYVIYDNRSESPIENMMIEERK